MKNKVEILVTIVFVSLFVMPIFAREFSFGPARPFDRPAEPRLVSPINETAVISGDTLLFKWWHANIGIDRYEFNLYKGGQMFKDNLILGKVLPFSQSSIGVDSSLFEDSQVYTWSLRQITDSGAKSDKSFNTFRAIKK